MSHPPMIDSAFHILLPNLQAMNSATLWLADESARPVLEVLQNQQQPLHIVTNRYDIFCLANNKGFSCQFNDFDLTDIPFIPATIVYRISKEKILSLYLLEKASQILGNNGTLIISGKKQEGIKGYGDKLIKQLGAIGTLKKMGNDYSGTFSFSDSSHSLIDAEDYRDSHTLTLAGQACTIPVCTKPGVFGWNKIDQGTELLLKYLPDILVKQPQGYNVLDLGCGYGWIFLNLPYCLPQHWSVEPLRVTATDNNAAALFCAQKNAEACQQPTQVIASDAGSHIQGNFDLILCNPPFHQGFGHDKSLTARFLEQAIKLLDANGMAIFVVNEFIQLPVPNKASHADIEHNEYCREGGYKLIVLTQKSANR